MRAHPFEFFPDHLSQDAFVYTAQTAMPNHLNDTIAKPDTGDWNPFPGCGGHC